MTGFRKWQPTTLPILVSFALLVGAATVGCGKKTAPAPKAEATRAEQAQPDEPGTVTYDEGRSTLVVTFQSGTTHEYSNVPREVYVGMMATPARGVYFTSYVNGRYPYRTIESGQGVTVQIQGQGAKPGKPFRPSKSRRQGR
ncbi:MAG: KTSC domain-containing protein [bacterium]